MKTFILYINIIFLLFSCSKNLPDTETDNSIFLEINKDILFETIANGNDLFKLTYSRFTINKMAPIEIWADLVIWGEGCYSYLNRDYTVTNPDSSVNITIDSENEFQITIITIMTGGEVDIVAEQIITYRIRGGLLEIEKISYEDNILEFITTSKWTTSSQNIGDLTMCDY
jgi:hypothetical protein